MAVASYKVTDKYNPNQYGVDELNAYYGAERNRTRRESVVSNAYDRYQSGLDTYNTYQDMIDRVMGTSVGLPERLKRVGQKKEGRDVYAQNQYTDITQQYEQGQITYDEYLQKIDEIGTFLQTEGGVNPIEDPTATGTGTSSLMGGALPAGESTKGTWMTDAAGKATAPGTPVTIPGLNKANSRIVIKGVGDIGNVVADAANTYNINEDNRYSKEYNDGNVSFDDYAKYLQKRLQTYKEGTQQSKEAQDVWKNAYNEGLNRTYKEMEAQYNAGTIPQEEWADFNKWFKEQTAKGGQTSLTLPKFAYQYFAPAQPKAGGETGTPNVGGVTGTPQVNVGGGNNTPVTYTPIKETPKVGGGEGNKQAPGGGGGKKKKKKAPGR